jgi:DNA-binding NtrC family response regulator
MVRVLVADDDPGLRLSVSTALTSAGQFHVDEAFDGLNAVEKARSQTYQVVILDVDMPRLNGLEALKLIKEHDPSTIVLIVTAYAAINDAVATVKEGAFNYLAKPIKSEELVALINKALMAQNLISNVANSAPILMEAGRKIIGNTAEMQKVFNIINKLSKVDTPVLIRGASGTGKELVARAIHANSARKEAKFVAINCSAIPENLFESELFGHEKGAFTGADQRKIGKFQFAEGGTLFLDEIGDLPLLMQVKMLRVLQEKMFTPVGANREIESNVRIIAATNRPLEEMITKGQFREDLFYRLNVIPIFLPSLAERKNDLENLVPNFIKKFNKAHNKRIVGTSIEAMSCLKKYNWPGNIRELENVIEHAFILENSNVLMLGSLPEYLLAATGTSISLPDLDSGDISTAHSLSKSGTQSGPHDNESDEHISAPVSNEALDFNRHKEQFEKEFIIKALRTFKGRINQTALHANIPKKTLLRKIEKYGIVAKDYAD